MPSLAGMPVSVGVRLVARPSVAWRLSPRLGMVVALTVGGALRRRRRGTGALRAGEEDVWTDVFAHLYREGPSSLVVRSIARIF